MSLASRLLAGTRSYADSVSRSGQFAHTVRGSERRRQEWERRRQAEEGVPLQQKGIGDGTKVWVEFLIFAELYIRGVLTRRMLLQRELFSSSLLCALQNTCTMPHVIKLGYNLMHPMSIPLTSNFAAQEPG